MWAPGATAVEVCGGFDGWERGVPMEKADTGVWSAFVPGLAEGDLYKYRVHGADGSVVMRSDPYAFSTELRPGTASRLAKMDFHFDDSAWMERRDKCRNRPLNIYELHAGSWKHKPGSTQPDGSDGWYNYEELAKELGISQGTVSHHLNVLVRDEFIRIAKDGSRLRCSLAPEAIESMVDDIRRLLL